MRGPADYIIRMRTSSGYGHPWTATSPTFRATACIWIRMLMTSPSLLGAGPATQPPFEGARRPVSARPLHRRGPDARRRRRGERCRAERLHQGLPEARDLRSEPPVLQLDLPDPGQRVPQRSTRPAAATNRSRRTSPVGRRSPEELFEVAERRRRVQAAILALPHRVSRGHRAEALRGPVVRGNRRGAARAGQDREVAAAHRERTAGGRCYGDWKARHV